MKNIKMVKYMLGYIWRADKGGIFWAVVNLIWMAVPTTFNAIIYMLLIDSIIFNKKLSYIIMIVALYALTQLVDRLLGGYIYEYRFNRLSLNVEKYCNKLFMEKCKSIDMECFDNPEFYDKLSRALSQVGQRAMQVFYQTMRLIRNVILFFIGISIFAALDPFMIIIALFSGVALYFLDIVFIKMNFKAGEEMTPINRLTDYFRGLLYNKQSISDVKQYEDLGDLITNKYENAEKKRIDMSTRLAGRKMFHNIKSQTFVVFSMTLAPYIYLAVQSYRTIISAANIPSMYNAFNLIADGMSEVSREISNLKESCLYIGQLYEILNYEPRIERDEGMELDAIETIEFNDVSFKYPNKDNYVLKNINISIKKGQKIAIVGINGTGKTTLVKLLLRYYDPSKGHIYINGVDLTQYNVKSVRRRMMTLFQDYQAYSIPVRQLVSCSEVSNDARVIDVLNEVGLSQVLSSGGNDIYSEYSRQFCPDGVVLSGGELQKLFIARMLYKAGDIYIMDEASSALDPISEYEINKLLMKVSKNHIAIMIAHRLSTVVDADTILLIEDGKVVEKGSHCDLLSLNGKYAHMFNLQAESYLSGNQGRGYKEAAHESTSYQNKGKVA